MKNKPRGGEHGPHVGARGGSFSASAAPATVSRGVFPIPLPLPRAGEVATTALAVNISQASPGTPIPAHGAVSLARSAAPRAPIDSNARANRRGACLAVI